MSGADRLRRLLGAELPKGLEALDADETQALYTLIADARQRQRDQLHQALEAALRHVPALARGTVRRILFPGDRS